MPVKVGLVSLVCEKNHIDSEFMIGPLAGAGMAMTPDDSEADVVIVNTCSFIDASKHEALEAIYEMSDGKATARRKGQKLIVAGCMSQRYQGALPVVEGAKGRVELPAVDAFIGLDQVANIVPVIRKVMGGEAGRTEFLAKTTTYIPDFDTPRVRLTPRHAAYVKIAEGCNHPCSFCIIPRIRGRHRSRTVESVVQEARRLVADGVKEINLISQDTTFFGMDRWTDVRPGPRSKVDSSKGESLASLLRELDRIEGDFWIRLLYTHPAHWSDELIETIAASRHVARYVDIPLQHVSDRMLTAMQRETDGAYIRDLIRRMRSGVPDIAIRTTFIVGFPGETEEDFTELLGFLEEARFDRVGVFKYSKEEGTKADRMDGHLSDEVKADRHARAMTLLQRLSKERGKSQVGRRLRVLVESPGVARSEGDAMEIDGSVRVPRTLPVGEFAEVTVTGATEYDLTAK
ncbi:MAG: 30S ribosomal protein S12 methylthiotransferase RimO [Verrucomicrobiota bacterium]